MREIELRPGERFKIVGPSVPPIVSDLLNIFSKPVKIRFPIAKDPITGEVYSDELEYKLPPHKRIKRTTPREG